MEELENNRILESEFSDIPYIGSTKYALSLTRMRSWLKWEGDLILHTHGGHLSIFILKWLKQNHIWEIVTNSQKIFTIPDLVQNV